ncbi:hypothetical protein Tco_1436155, partial [Tanacetum coccineum]
SILQAGNPVKEILHKLNLLDHRLILTDSKVTPTGTDIKEIDKNKGKADKTEHGNEKSMRKRVQRCLRILLRQPVTHFNRMGQPKLS